VYAVILLSGEELEFDDEGGVVNSYRGTIDGTTRQGQVISIKLDDVRSVRTDRTNTTKTVLWTVAILGAIVGLVAIIVSQPDAEDSIFGRTYPSE
jgi:hypothetical protein